MFYINDKIIQFKNHIISSAKNRDIPPNTIRVQFAAGYTPTMGDTQTLVDETNNVWDIYKQSNDWYRLFNIDGNNRFDKLLKVLGANTSNVTNMSGLFRHCSVLTSVSLFDTSNVTDMSMMFSNCVSLTTVPLFNTSKVTTMDSMFFNDGALIYIPLFDTSNVTNMNHMCTYCGNLRYIPLFNTSKVTNMDMMFTWEANVYGGALALYQQASTQANPPASHSQTFSNCGVNTQTGRAELALIPDDWK